MTASPVLLIVEDNARNLKLARDVLVHIGYRTLQAQTAEQAVALARSHRPDMILMDIQLPGMDGLEALAQLQSDPATAGIPVIAFTAFAMKDDRERFLAAGFHGYIEKPISVRDFPGQVADLLATANARSRT
jgi:two-component system cell cycle response regulator DivK